MPNCCYADEYGRMFTRGAARRTARRYLRRGLRGTARRLADQVAAAGIGGATVLEVGGGVGEIQVDLLRRGAASATNVELSPSWEAAASELLDRLGLRGRVQRRVGDVVDLDAELSPATVVILHRVVCCYPDWRAMLDASVSGSARVVGVTLPVDRRASRLAVRIGNALLRLQGRSFRAYVHPPDRLLETLRADGFEVVADSHGPVWRTFVAERPGGAARPAQPARAARKPAA